MVPHLTSYILGCLSPFALDDTAPFCTTTQRKANMTNNQAAWLTEAKTTPLKIDDAPLPELKPGEVLIKNAAVAINVRAFLEGWGGACGLRTCRKLHRQLKNPSVLTHSTARRLEDSEVRYVQLQLSFRTVKGLRCLIGCDAGMVPAPHVSNMHNKATTMYLGLFFSPNFQWMGEKNCAGRIGTKRAQ